ncbi:aroma-sacti cluster domain-containing protein [Dictyobacter formicarum]|uniref:Uncharacterized protein n=1 Tax=Dictyobacter formicarum TaxID=2778368 RepID=A0ABQ3VRF9_9CHLR|nr:aroma-sacti cluster domain-containing protein [Dictyobacter formicarum]GHO88857.1 hypothetical protein KSZ_68630 [Dictyobacter formicarum]
MTAQFDPIKALEDAGLSFDRVSDAEREALKQLTPEEVRVLVKVRKQMEEVHEVIGQADVAGGIGL